MISDIVTQHQGEMILMLTIPNSCQVSCRDSNINLGGKVKIGDQIESQTEPQYIAEARPCEYIYLCYSCLPLLQVWRRNPRLYWPLGKKIAVFYSFLFYPFFF